jgi:GR25 family glycosyltransferase involved in LPS biosynthesis
MKINEIPKFVINLKRRPDRLGNIKKELEYIGWGYELFEAVDENSHLGCALSHLGVVKIAKERGYDSVMVIEDDCSIMPYAKDFISKIESETGNFEFAICNLSPTLNRPVSISEHSPLFLDLTKMPEKLEHHRDVHATNMIIYHSSIYDDLFDVGTTKYSSPHYYAIDEFIARYIMPFKQSYATILPVAPQMSDWSDVSGGNFGNFYMQTYNWNLYSPYKIPGEFLDYGTIQKIKEDKTHKDFYYVN